MKFLDFLAPSPKGHFPIPSSLKRAFLDVVSPLYEMGIISFVSGGAVLAAMYHTPYGDEDVVVLCPRIDVAETVEAFLLKRGFDKCSKSYPGMVNQAVFFNRKTTVNVILSWIGAETGSDVFQHYDLDICKVGYTPWHTYIKTDEHKRVMEDTFCNTSKTTSKRADRYRKRFPNVEFAEAKEFDDEAATNRESPEEAAHNLRMNVDAW